MLTTRQRKRRVASYIGAGIVDPAGTPQNSAPPEITGTAQVGETLTGSDGTWTESPTFARQWLADGVAIEGETGTTYVPVADDVGKVIALRVTATANGRTKSAVSEPTDAVIAAA
ncbi:hypothetical protein [Devosia elaeis]|uniref:Uncharacterized protein n=1 Tax=Devosia elaeis TaxID=1770058 RepID=A0A178HY05_9HYPH|nr:hypothetical protein [Devosia elaeis]OAM77703.1 hypothetical protein A3840_08715 [Devosia elaeis]